MIKKDFIILCIVTFCIMVITTVILYFCIINDENGMYALNQERLKQTDYIPTSKRDSFVIKKASESYLSNYMSNENMLVVFFATWCPHCVDEAVALNDFITKNEAAKVIVVSHDTKENELKTFLETSNYNWFTILDSDKTIRENLDPGSHGIPCMYLINKDSKILQKYSGPATYDTFVKLYKNIDVTKEGE